MLLWFFLTCYGLHCFTWWFTGLSLLVDALLIFPYWVWHVLFHFHHWFIIIVHELYSFMSCFTGSSLPDIVCIVSHHDSLVLPYWEWFALFHFVLCQFFPTGQVLCCFTSCYASSSLLEVVCIVSFRAIPVLPYWEWFVLFHFVLYRFCPTGHRLYCTTSNLTGSSLLSMVGFFLTVHGLHCFMSPFIGSSLLGIAHIVSFHDSLVLPYRAWLELFHFMLCWFLLNGLVYIVSLQASRVHYHSYIALFVLFHFPYWFILLFVVCVISLHSSLVHHYWAWLLVFHCMPH